MKSILIKKELKAFIRSFLRKKDGTYGDTKRGILIALLFVFLFGSVGFSVFFMLSGICGPIVYMGIDWLYFSLISIAILSIGVIGGIFTAYTSIYKAKDNDFLLSLPVSASDIIVSRMIGVWTITLFFSLIVGVPALIAYYVNGRFSFVLLIENIIFILSLSLISVTICCVLGWVIAQFAARVSGNLKNAGIMIVSILGFGAYFLFVNRMYDIVESIIGNLTGIAADFSGNFNPLYIAGEAGAGDIVRLLILFGASLILIAAAVLLIRPRFGALATASKAAKAERFDSGRVKVKGARGALLGREFKHLFNSPVYLLNCALGALMVPLITGILLFNIPQEAVGDLKAWVGSFADETVIGLVCSAVVVFMSSMCYITAPSISIEGKNFWILKSAPINPMDVLGAKLLLHIIVAEIPSVACIIVLDMYFGMPAVCTVLGVLTVVLFVIFQALFGLCVNLIKYNFNWTSEIFAVKQGASVVISMFGNMLVTLAVFLPYLLVMSSGILYQIIVAVLMLVLCAVLFLWLRSSGIRRYNALEV